MRTNLDIYLFSQRKIIYLFIGFGLLFKKGDINFKKKGISILKKGDINFKKGDINEITLQSLHLRF